MGTAAQAGLYGARLPATPPRSTTAQLLTTQTTSRNTTTRTTRRRHLAGQSQSYYGQNADYYGRQNDVELQQPENAYKPPEGPPPTRRWGREVYMTMFSIRLKRARTGELE